MGAAPHPHELPRQQRRVVLAAALGTVFEWYDFYLVGALASLLAQRFFAGLGANPAFILALLAFASGFLVRPFGALLFGRLGDLIGRKYTFLVTILLMGLSTFTIGLLPTQDEIGVAAPLILLLLRLLQGLAMGGEYGGAAAYVAECADAPHRGAMTGWVQTAATLGLCLSLLLIQGLRFGLGAERFADWGWRLPFLFSIVLLGASIWMRLQLPESPAFSAMRQAGRGAKAPLREALGQRANQRLLLLALFGLTAGQGVTWYASQFYALLFITRTLHLDSYDATLLVVSVLLVATPLFRAFGALSDRVGRKPIILGGCLLSACTLFPAFYGLTAALNPQLLAAQRNTPVLLLSDARHCHPLLDPVGFTRASSACDIAHQLLGTAAVDYRRQQDAGPTRIRVGRSEITVFDGSAMSAAEQQDRQAMLEQDLKMALLAAAYPQQARPGPGGFLCAWLILLLLSAEAAMVYGPTAAALAELFPTRIRYTSMSLPYHIGNGWFGGLLPAIAVVLVGLSGNTLAGLWYPVLVAATTALIGALLLPETRGRDLQALD